MSARQLGNNYKQWPTKYTGNVGGIRSTSIIFSHVLPSSPLQRILAAVDRRFVWLKAAIVSRDTSSRLIWLIAHRLRNTGQSSQKPESSEIRFSDRQWNVRSPARCCLTSELIVELAADRCAIIDPSVMDNTWMMLFFH
jgi:hypothetical protein